MAKEWINFIPFVSFVNTNWNAHQSEKDKLISGYQFIITIFALFS